MWINATRQDDSQPRRALERILAGCTKSEAIQFVADAVRGHTEPVAMCYFERGDDGELTRDPLSHSEQADCRHARLANHLRAGCEAACKSGGLYVRHQAAPARVILAAPVMLRGRDPEALGVIFPATASLELSVMLVQVAASYLALW
ncbi:MAG: hypothetical protein HQ582_33780, partial [Planctomycetes bacterium]|nr:hypothetical protein [Planctomycetota bacterium]